ncbi:MAG: enolase C-terminal domain-like protein [Azospirillaceae bacterium]
MSATVRQVRGRRVWDSRARPTVEAEIILDDDTVARAIAPAGASTGRHEATDRRDGGTRYGGYDVRQAVVSLNAEVAEALIGQEIGDQQAIDSLLVRLDGTENRSRLGGNVLIAVSMAVAKAAAASRHLPLWRHLSGGRDCRLPLPEIQIFGGGAHAGGRIDIQDLMVIANGADDFAQALDWTADVYHAARELMDNRGRLSGLADEGGMWPAFDSNQQALDTLLAAIEHAGRRPGEEVSISVDIAASNFGQGGRYRLTRDGKVLDSDSLSDMLLGWLRRYPIIAIEDPLAEDDLAGLSRFTRAAGPRVQVIADDLVVTNAGRIGEAAAAGAGNAALIKPNQVGTLSETLDAVAAARAVGWGCIASARSGETEDVTIAHLAVGWQLSQLKVGAIARSERTAKWNECLRIADDLASGLALPPPETFPWAGS